MQIKFIRYPNNTWRITNDDVDELCSYSRDHYASLFELYAWSINNQSKVLIIGGGDQQLAAVIRSINSQAKVTIVDPAVHQYFPEKWGIYDDILEGRSIGADTIRLSFKNAVDAGAISADERYTHVIVDCSSPLIKGTEEIYSEEFIHTLFRITPNAKIKFYNTSATVELVATTLQGMQVPFHIESEFIPAWREIAYVVSFDTDMVKPMHQKGWNLSIKLKSKESQERIPAILNTYAQNTFNVVATKIVVFPNDATSGTFILSESHLNYHTYPEDDIIAIDISTCSDSIKPLQVVRDLHKVFNSEVTYYLPSTKEPELNANNVLFKWNLLTDC